MKKNDLYEAISEINRDYIMEAESFDVISVASKKKNQRFRVIMTSAICASLFGIGLFGLHQSGLFQKNTQLSEKVLESEITTETEGDTELETETESELETETESEKTEQTSNRFQHIYIEPVCETSFGFEFDLPDSLSYEIAPNDEESPMDLKANIYPKDNPTTILSIQYTNSFGVCGTELETRTIDLNGRSATQGFYHGNELWSYISLDCDYSGCVIIMENDALYCQYEDEMEIILNSLNFIKFEKAESPEESESEIPVSQTGPCEFVLQVFSVNCPTESFLIHKDESDAIQNIIDNCKWEEGTADCMNDFGFIIDANTTIYYHSECGTLNDTKNERSYQLTEEQKEHVNRIIDKTLANYTLPCNE